MVTLDKKGLAAPLQNLTPASTFGLDLIDPWASGCGPSGLTMTAVTLPWK